MSIKKYIATDKHLYMKAGTEITVLKDGKFTASACIGAGVLLKTWIIEGWCVEVEEPKWTDSELKVMCIEYAEHAHTFHHAQIETEFDEWFTGRTNPIGEYWS